LISGFGERLAQRTGGICQPTGFRVRKNFTAREQDFHGRLTL
jgi:hypothetical protein